MTTNTFKVSNTSDGVIITKTEREVAGCCTIFLILWHGILLKILSICIEALISNEELLFIHALGLIFATPLLIIGFCPIYCIILQWFNTLQIVANSNAITVDYKPIPDPCFKNKVIRSKKIELIYITSKSETEKSNGYEIRALKTSGADKYLLDFTHKDEAFFIGQTLEKVFNVEYKLSSENSDQE